ncbi:MAG TPA: DnaB-like helicase C-terminal domain-containing protein [Patescibacteria group bacterium]|nr:DnaB-like helicase C-terminal domain-containing protein [Patescibacteria group bacterium]
MKLKKHIKMNLQQINDRIKEIEEWQQQGMDKTEATSLVEEALKEYVGDDRIVAIKEYVMPIVDQKNSIVSGIADLDKIIGRFKKGDIFTITAGSGVGKSTFARELLIRFSEQGKKCLYFSYEDRNEGLIEKLGEDIPDGYIPNVLTEKSLTWIDARILESILKYKVEIVFIDNLKAITDFSSRNVNNSIEATMQRIKEIAMKYNISIFLCAHIKKEEGKIIDINSIKDSSAVADISTLVFALKRLEAQQNKKDKLENGIKKTNYTLVSIIKNRNNGKEESFKLLFVPKGESGRYIQDTNQNIVSQEEIKVEY